MGSSLYRRKYRASTMVDSCSGDKERKKSSSASKIDFMVSSRTSNLGESSSSAIVDWKVCTVSCTGASPSSHHAESPV